MIVAVALAMLQAAGAVETLPIDERMAAHEAAVPGLRAAEARVEEQIGRLGIAEPGWDRSGVSAASAIAGRGDSADDDVLGEWEVGGHGVVIAGDRPLAVPRELRRYSVRDHGGPVDFHTYHRLLPDVIIHSFGPVTRIGNAECHHARGIELISRQAWRDWPEPTQIIAFAVARLARDDRRTYCMIYRPVANGRYSQLAYAPDGRPYIVANEDPQAFVVTRRAEAGARIFATTAPVATD